MRESPLTTSSMKVVYHSEGIILGSYDTMHSSSTHCRVVFRFSVVHTHVPQMVIVICCGELHAHGIVSIHLAQ